MVQIRFFFTCAAILVLPAVVFGAVASDGGSEGLLYDINAVVDVERREVRARAVLTIPFSALSAPGEVHLDPLSAGSGADGQPLMRIQQITGVASGRALQWTETDELIRVVLPENVASNGKTAIAVQYSVPLSDTDRAMLGYYIFSGHAPGSLWYPDVVGVDGEREHFRDFRVTLTYPEQYAVMTSGSPEGEVAEKEGKMEARFAADHVEGFSLSLGEGFVLTEVVKGDDRVVAFSSPELAGIYRRVAELAAETVAWYRKTYGFFPVRQIGVLQGHPRWGGGFPLPNAFMIHQGNLTEKFLRWITSHELAHYYWGLHILGDEERLDWLQLSNGIWTDQLYMAGALGRTLDEQWQSRGSGDWYIDYIRTMAGNHEQRLGLSRQEEQALDFDYNSRVRHGKAAVGLFLQARLLGREKYLELQRQLLEDYRYKPLPVKDFVDRLTQAGLEHAEEFFETWKRGDATIGFTVAVDKAERTAEGWQYDISVRRTGTVKYPVTVEVRDVDGKEVRRELAGREDKETFQITLQSPLSGVLLDPEGVLPMWNSSHPSMQKFFLRALSQESLWEPFFGLARSYLESNPDDEEVRYLLTAGLFGAGRYPAVISSLHGLPRGSCEVAYQCRSAIYLARALTRVGRAEEAATLLSAIERDSLRLNLENNWSDAHKEVEAPPVNRH